MRNTLAISSLLKRSVCKKSACGASGCSPFANCLCMGRRKYHTVQVMAITKAVNVAYALLRMPNMGKPPQPRIKAGVSTIPTKVEISSVSMGVLLSPTPRNMDVNSKKT